MRAAAKVADTETDEAALRNECSVYQKLGAAGLQAGLPHTRCLFAAHCASMVAAVLAAGRYQP